MKKACLTVLALVIAGALALPAEAQLQLPRVSQKASVSQTVGLTEITITYSRPGVKGRQIWGELVPFGKVWRLGANEATTIALSDAATVGGKQVAAGTYGLFAIPGESEWTIILNAAADQWGAYSYDQSKDVARFTVQPSRGCFEEWMRFSFEDLTEDSTEVVLAWKDLEVRFPVTVEVNEKVLASARAAMGSLKDGDWQTPYRAAMFAVQHDLDTAEATTWLDRSIEIKPTFQNEGARARLYAAAGSYGEAVTFAERAIALGKEAQPPADTAELERLVAEWRVK